MARYAQRLLESDRGMNASMSDRVRRLVVLLLPRGHCRVEIVAQQLGVDRRTIANHLAAEKTTFSALVDIMRRDLLERYAKEGARTLSEVAPLLGFSELSALSRWRRRQLGVTARTRGRKKGKL
jgi:AraC-like DNA-binding protein